MLCQVGVAQSPLCPLDVTHDVNVQRAYCWASWPTPRITQPVRSRPTSMTWHASEMARSRSHDVFLYATQYGYSVGSTLIERVLRFPWVSTWKRLLCCSLSRTTTPALWVSVLVVGKEAYARDAEDEQLTFLWRLVDISDSATTTTSPGQVILHQQQLEQAASFLLACQWRRPKIVQLRTGWRHARQHPDFLLLFGTCGDSLSGTTTGDGAAEWIKTIVLSSPFSSTSNRRTELKLGITNLRGLRNTLVQKN